MIALIKKYLRGTALVCGIIAPIMMMLESFMDLQQPTLMSNIIDIGVVNHNLHYVLTTGGIMVACALVGFVGGTGNSLFASIAAISLAKRLREVLFRKIQQLSYVEIDRLKTSSLITRLTNDVLQTQNMTMQLMRIMFRAPIMCIGGIVMSILLIPKLSVLFVVLLPILVVCITVVLKKSMPLFVQVQERLDRVNTVMRENLLGARVIKAFGIEKRQYDHFHENNTDYTEKSIQAQTVIFTLTPVMTLTLNLSVVCVLWFGGVWVVHGSVEIGKIMAFVNYLTQITNSVMACVNLLVSISRAQASAARINEVMDTEPSIVEPKIGQHPVDAGIEFRNVYFRYEKTAEPVLRNLSFTVNQGKTLGVIGATGSGKSTLVSLIPRLYDVTEGSILMGGVDVRSISQSELRHKIGMVMQESVLFYGTVADNLRFANPDATDEDLVSAAADAQADFIEMLPDKYDHPVEQRGRNFSGGQKQRLSIARTLLCNSDILILDDSTSAIDLTTEARLRYSIAGRMRGKTVIIIAQRISAIKNADQILVLEHGRISAMGSHDELIKNSPIYRSIVVSQLGEKALTNAAC